MHDTLKNQFNREGYIVLDDFLRPAECEELIKTGVELAKDQPETDRTIWSESPPYKQFEKGSPVFDSGRKILYFYEDEPSKSLHKIGHALHVENPIFRCYTYSDRVKAVCQQLGLVDPVVVQSTYIYKNNAAEVPAHQESSYLFAEPVPVIYFWIALEDSTVQNGCLWIARGSHTSGVHIRLIRNPDQESKDAFIYDRQFPMYPRSSFTAIPVRKGSCILLHGNVVHKYGANRTDKSLNSYSFHILEKHNNRFFDDNWIYENNQQFLPVYTTSQII